GRGEARRASLSGTTRRRRSPHSSISTLGIPPRTVGVELRSGSGWANPHIRTRSVAGSNRFLRRNGARASGSASLDAAISGRHGSALAACDPNHFWFGGEAGGRQFGPLARPDRSRHNCISGRGGDGPANGGGCFRER